MFDFSFFIIMLYFKNKNYNFFLFLFGLLYINDTSNEVLLLFEEIKKKQNNLQLNMFF